MGLQRDLSHIRTARSVVHGLCKIHPLERDRLLEMVLKEYDHKSSLLADLRNAAEHQMTGTPQGQGELQRVTRKVNNDIGDRPTYEKPVNVHRANVVDDHELLLA